MARRTSYRRSKSPTRKFIWAREGFINAPIPANGNPLNQNLLQEFQTAYGAQVIGATIMRIRGTILIEQGADNAAPVVVRTGVRIVQSIDRLNDGPFTAPYDDWMGYYSTVTYRDPSADLSLAHGRFEVDIKSSRKLEELGEGLMLISEQSGTADVDMTIDLSIGIKLP